MKQTWYEVSRLSKNFIDSKDFEISHLKPTILYLVNRLCWNYALRYFCVNGYKWGYHNKRRWPKDLYQENFRVDIYQQNASYVHPRLFTNGYILKIQLAVFLRPHNFLMRQDHCEDNYFEIYLDEPFSEVNMLGDGTFYDDNQSPWGVPYPFILDSFYEIVCLYCLERKNIFVYIS